MMRPPVPAEPGPLPQGADGMTARHAIESPTPTEPPRSRVVRLRQLAKTGTRGLVGLPREAREPCSVSGTTDPFGIAEERVFASGERARENPADPVVA
jgi:hypothetical protein